MQQVDMKLTRPCPAQQGQGPLTPDFSPHPPHEAALGTRIEVGGSLSKVLGRACGAGRLHAWATPPHPAGLTCKQNPKVSLWRISR